MASFHLSPHNVPSFRACCNLLASLSGYQYTRRAWKKEVMELLLDPSFFQMDITCIGSWRTIIDNLMTQDNTSFKELMTRVAGLSQSASINIFANREQVLKFLWSYFYLIWLFWSNLQGLSKALHYRRASWKIEAEFFQVNQLHSVWIFCTLRQFQSIMMYHSLVIS